MSMTKIAGSGSISQRHGSADPDPHQNVMDPEHCRQQLLLFWKSGFFVTKLVVPCAGSVGRKDPWQEEEEGARRLRLWQKETSQEKHKNRLLQPDQESAGQRIRSGIVCESMDWLLLKGNLDWWGGALLRSLVNKTTYI